MTPIAYAACMRFTLRSATTIALTLVLGGCLAGPHQLRRSVDDWDHSLYVNSPWWNAALWVLPVFPVSHTLAMVGDFLVTDPWAFWFDDAWDGAGTGFEHLQVESTDGHMDSLFIDRALWTRIDR